MASVEHKLIRCAEDDPNRCQAVGKFEQCPYAAVEGETLCYRHNYAHIASVQAATNLRNYRLGKWQERINEFADNEKVKSLREEIGIARIMLEEIILRCKDSSDLILFTPRISELIVKIEKLVVSCHRLEEKTGILMDKAGAIQLAGSIVEIVSKFVIDPDDRDKIADQIIVVICGVIKGEEHGE